ncbi:DNA/RNA-binding protein KIN17, putative [Plasmodium ovale]|uniref:DNA/RNA-binding protein KIN17, putative n=2 Tax=Plasmodium ovale TaxID=36330 RepID=A0A1A8W5C8_PLAOA|nr:DNA/RNA-binding protein KIN17, putative [Plasmodium ovale curtisi]SCP05607.1 DNA/RNA-binding protein KIN17, putative [Plasmodium ovale]
MPRAEPGTPKWLANKMKAKGLQKLKWYCQMCEKQCRDENGFKCHRLSETHQRQMQIFCEDANKFMDEYSTMFEKEFMRLMKTKYCRTRILANTVYTNMISDKTHIHMNATVWVTLTDFVLYLGKTGKCKIEQTERGWYLEYIDREKIEREKAYQERKKIEYSYEELKERKINLAIEEAKKKGNFIESEYTGIEKKSDEKIVIASIKTGHTDGRNNDRVAKSTVNVFVQEALKRHADEEAKKKKKEDALLYKQKGKGEEAVEKGALKKRPMSSLELLILENEEKKKRKSALSSVHIEKCKDGNLTEKHDERNGKNGKNQEDSTSNWWICKNIIVKIIDKKHKYYDNKGVIVSVSSDEKYNCEIRMSNSGKTVTAHQKQLQTVIPKSGRKVMVLRGKYRGYTGEVKKIPTDQESAVISIFGKNSDKIIAEQRMLFDDVCKLEEK